MPSIRANEFTYLKKAPIQSDELGADDLCDVSAGKSYSVEEYNVADGGHYLVKLAYDMERSLETLLGRRRRQW